MPGQAQGRGLGAGSTGYGWPSHVLHDPSDLGWCQCGLVSHTLLVGASCFGQRAGNNLRGCTRDAHRWGHTGAITARPAGRHWVGLSSSEDPITAAARRGLRKPWPWARLFPTFARRDTMRDRSPMRMSVYTLRSWASSMITTLYWDSRKSWEWRPVGEAGRPGLKLPQTPARGALR